MTAQWRRALLASLALTGLYAAPAAPAGAETVEELKAKLAAQEQINELLKQRIRSLEGELSGREASAPSVREPEASPASAAGDPEEDLALERTLVRRGTSVLPPHAVEITPSLAWSRSGSDFRSSTQDLYGLGLDARIGLLGGWMLGASVPVLYREAPNGGRNAGIGDFSATVWKSIWSQDDAKPSLVASIRYTAPTGEDLAADAVPLGSGFHSVSGRLSSVKTIAPIAFYGDVSYTRFLGETIRGIDLNRSGIFGFNVGASLAVTPEISLSTGIDFDFEDALSLGGIKIRGSGTTKGAVELGVGILLSRHMFLTFSGAFGITDDSPDVTLGVSLPIRF